MPPTDTGTDAATPSGVSRSIPAKIAAVNAAFWVMKIAATTLGETAGDLMSMTMKVGYAVSSLILLGGFLVAVAIQFRARRYHPVLFWTVILATSTAGTTLSDFMDRTLGIGYAKGSLILVVGLLATLAAWRLLEGHLSVTRIDSRRSEVLYWTSILFSNTLGTALGDYLADDSGLGFGGSAALIGGVLAVIVLAFLFTRLNRVLLFWAAFVLTRPFGATFGDLLTKPADKGGLNLGTVGSSVVLGAILAVFVAREQLAQRRAPKPAPG